MPTIHLPSVKSVTYSASGTWVCPPNVTEVTLLGCGGGQGGFLGAGSAAGWGGRGAPVAELRIPVTPGTSYTITIGAGGAAGGAYGQASSFGAVTFPGAFAGPSGGADMGEHTAHAYGGFIEEGVGYGGGASLGNGGTAGVYASTSATPGLLGGGGAGSSDGTGPLKKQPSAGGSGCVIVKWIGM
jgi:hypothetical protein